MKVLVTGAGGFLGTAVVDALVRDGHDVRAMVRRAPSTMTTGPRLQVVEADLRTSELGPPLEGIDVVVHLAARVSGSDEARFSSTVVGTERLLDALTRSAVRRLVLVSSYSVYDWSRVLKSLDESAPVLERPYGRDSYAVAKLWQERLCREAAERSDLDLVVLRPGFIWGPGHSEISGAGVPIGGHLFVVGPSSRLPLTYVSNCADCVAIATAHPAAEGGTFNVVDDEVVSAWSYAGAYLRSRGGGRRVPVPYALARAFVRVVSGVSRRVFSQGGKLPGVLVPASFEARFRPLEHNATRARQVLGWRPQLSYAQASRLTYGGEEPQAVSRANG